MCDYAWVPWCPLKFPFLCSKMGMVVLKKQPSEICESFINYKALLKCLQKVTRIYAGYQHQQASLVAQLVKNLPAIQETQVRFLDWEDPLQKTVATHSSILAWRSQWTEEPGGLQSMGLKELDTTE